MVVMQCHVLGVVVVPPLLVAWLADVRGRRRRDERLGPLVAAGAGGLAILAAGYLPLLAYELQHEFAETRAILDYIGGGGASAASGVLARIGIVGGRSLAWPVSGVLTDRPLLAVLAIVAVIALAAVAILGERGTGRRAAAWLAGSVAWSVVAARPVRPEPRPDHAGPAQRPLPLVPRPAACSRSWAPGSPGWPASRDRRRRTGRRRRIRGGRSRRARPGRRRHREGRLRGGRRDRHRAPRRLRRRVAPGGLPRRRLAARGPGGRPDDRGAGRRVGPARAALRARRHPAVQERERPPLPARAPRRDATPRRPRPPAMAPS